MLQNNKKRRLLAGLSIAGFVIFVICASAIGLRSLDIFKDPDQWSQERVKKEIAPYTRRDNVSERRPSGELLRNYQEVTFVNTAPRVSDITPYDGKEDKVERRHDTAPPGQIQLKQAPVIMPQPAGAYHVSVAAPPGRDMGFSDWKPAPVPLSEIVEKRKRIAQGERLYKSVIIKRTEPFSRPVSADAAGIDN